MDLRLADNQKISKKEKWALQLAMFLLFFDNKSYKKVITIDKRNIIKELCYCARLYEKNLTNKNIMFIYKDRKVKYIETKFTKSNFLHLTGITMLNPKINANMFYNQCLHNRIEEKLLGYRKDGNTIKKMSVLAMLMNIHKNAKMIGDYDGNRVFLYSNKLIGNINSCLGFIPKDKYYICNTSLKEDIRNITYNHKKIICILSKKIQEKQYNEITYINPQYREDIYDTKEIMDKISEEKREKFAYCVKDGNDI